MPVGMSVRGIATCAEALEQKPAIIMPAKRNGALCIRLLLKKSTLISDPEQKLKTQFGRIAMIGVVEIHKCATLRRCGPPCGAILCERVCSRSCESARHVAILSKM